MSYASLLVKKLDLTPPCWLSIIEQKMDNGTTMRIFIGGLFAETNSFSPIFTGRSAFTAQSFFGDATQHAPTLASAPLHVWRQVAEENGFEVCEGLCASAEAGGPLSQEIFEYLRDHLLSDLAKAGPVDIVLLSLHGSMIAQGYDDCEGDLLNRVRRVVGKSAIVAAELDLHCSVTKAMQEASDILVTYKHSPHTDIDDRAREVIALALAAARRDITPVTAVHECRMVSTWPTDREPMAGFVRLMQDYESRDGILSVSFVHGFGLADVPESGARLMVIADIDEGLARTAAAQLAGHLWDMRHETARTWESLDNVMAKVTEAEAKAIVIADFCDNPGGGAPGDATHLLRALLDRGIGDIACGIIWDPGAVALCMAAGEGAKIDLRIGGKVCRASGQPLDLSVEIMRVIEQAQQPFEGAAEPIGDAVWVRAADNVDIVLASVRKQTFHPDAFRQFGIVLEDKRAIVVKSSNHFRAGFVPIATEIVFPATDGLLTLDYAGVPYQRFTTPFWPRVADPFDE